MSLKKRPYGDRILLVAPVEEKSVIELDDKTKAAIEAEKRKDQKFEIAALGTNLSKECALKVGDFVYWQGHGTEMEFDGVTYILIREYDVLVID